MRRLVPLLALALLAPPASAAADVRGVVHQRLVALLNPLGLELNVRAGVRGSLGDQGSLLFSGAHAEAGGVSYLTPVYAVHGGYLRVSPLSFLVLSAELTGTAMWPIGMTGAGYYGLDGYDADVRDEALPPEAGGTASGWELTLGATLQGALPIESTRLLIASALSAQHASLGDAAFNYSLRHDLVLARQDWLLTNDAVLLLEIPLDPGTHVLVGAFDQTRYVPESGYVGHQVGPLAALSFTAPSPEVTSIDVYVRGGMYSDHVTRAGTPTVLGGLSVRYDLGAIRAVPGP